MTVQRARAVAVLILLALAVGACSSGPAASVTQRPGATGAPTARATPPASAAATAALTPLPPIGDAICDVVTEAEMFIILAGKAVAPNRTKAEPDNCDWSSPDFTVHINIHEDELGTIEALRLADRNVEELDVGEGGIYSDVSRGAYLKKGNRVLAVQIVLLPAGLNRRDVAVAIATAGLPRF